MAKYAIGLCSVYILCVVMDASMTAFVEHIVNEKVVTGTVGQRIILPCTPSINVSVRWLYQRSENSEADEIYFNGFLMNGYRKLFEVPSAASGNYTLVVWSATLANSGVYTCWEENGQGDQHLVYLTVMRNSEMAPVRSSSTSTTTTTTMSTMVDSITHGFGGSNSGTRIIAASISVAVVLVVVTIACIAAILIIKRRRQYLDVMQSLRCCMSHTGDTERTRLLQDKTWESIYELEKSVYSTRKHNPKEWTNNRFVVGVAREPEYFSLFLARLKEKVQTNMVHAIVGINSSDCRGELIAAPLAYSLKIPYVSVSMTATRTRQEGVETETFESTKGETVTLEIVKDEGLANKRVVIIDSFYSTGESSRAAKKLVERALRVTVVETIVFTAVEAIPENSGVRAIFRHDD